MTTGVKQLTTGAIWCAGYGTPTTPGGNVIGDWAKLVEFYPWESARDTLIGMMQSWAERVDQEQELRHHAMTLEPGYQTAKTAVAGVLSPDPFEVDQEVTVWVETDWNHERTLFTIERDSA